MIVWLDRGRCRRIGFVLVAATRIVEQGWNDRQQYDHDHAEDGDDRDQELDDGHSAIMARQTVKNMCPTLAFAFRKPARAWFR
jgi:hypothetical protein